MSSRSDYKRNHGRVGNIRREVKKTGKNLVPVLYEKENNPRANIQEISHPLQQSAIVSRRVLNEYNEQNFNNEHVWARSIKLGHIPDRSNEYVINEKKEERSGSSSSNIKTKTKTKKIIGCPDNGYYPKLTSLLFRKPTVMIECKSSRDLLIPNRFNEIKEMHGAGIKHQTGKYETTNGGGRRNGLMYAIHLDNCLHT